MNDKGNGTACCVMYDRFYHITAIYSILHIHILHMFDLHRECKTSSYGNISEKRRGCIIILYKMSEKAKKVGSQLTVVRTNAKRN